MEKGILTGSKSGSDLLPEELWGEVGKRVDCRLDVQRFRSVCKSWRSILPPPTLFPLNIPPPFATGKYSRPTRSLFPWFITENSVCAIAGAHPDPDVVVLEDMGLGGKFLHSDLCFSGSGDRDYGFLIDLLDKKVQVTQLAKYYHIRTVEPEFDNLVGNRAYGKCRLRVDLRTSKTVLVSNCDDSYNPSYVTDHSNLAFVVISHLGDLAVLRNHGHTIWEWETFPRPPGAAQKFDDIVSHKGRLYVVDSQGMTFVMDDFKSMKMTQLGSYDNGLFFRDSLRFERDYKRRFVVEGTGRNGDLYLVVLKRETPTIKIYKLVQTHGWLEVQSLGNQALFVGYQFSFSISDAAKTISSKVINSIFLDTYTCFNDYQTYRKHVSVVEGEKYLPPDAFKEVDNENNSKCTRYTIRGLYLATQDSITEVAAATSSVAAATAANSTSTIISQYESSCWKNWVNYEIYGKEKYPFP